jgi:pyrroline-5-carboxylate reductase
MSLKDRRIGFVGGGAMAEALLGGLRAAGAPAESLLAADGDAARRERLHQLFGIHTTDDNCQLLDGSDVVVLAVKPGVVPVVLEHLAGHPERARPLWISIAAGVTLAKLEAGLPESARVVRAMPNTPALVRAGATAFCANSAATQGDRAAAQELFEGVGTCWEAPQEELLDAVTGLSGSGPAYVFAFLEALTDAGEAEGLPRATASELAYQTVYGAALLAKESPRNPADLRRQVSSPGGTTLAGLAELDAADFHEAVHRAVRAATKRAGELGRGE